MKLAVSCGDLNGIGLECFFKALLNYHFNEISFHLFCNIETLKSYISQLEIFKNLIEIKDNSIIINNNLIKIISFGNEFPVRFGRTTFEAGLHAIESIELATRNVISKEYDAILTLPISKESCRLAGLKFNGHTEFIASMCQVKQPLMILFYNNLRVALQTIHVPIKDVPNLIIKNKIVEKLEIFYKSLSLDFAVNPKIAVLGLNPHSGENGLIGNEEILEIIPSINELSNKGYDIYGPFAADGFFASNSYNKYSGIFAMYHDQGLIPLKFYSKGEAVNFTAGLPIIRTSPDHGTAFDISGLGIARYESTLNAIIAAKEIYFNRLSYESNRKQIINEQSEK